MYLVPNPRPTEIAERKIREQEQRRDSRLSQVDTSRKQLSRRASLFILLTTLFLIIVGVIIFAYVFS